jgi:protein-tyrosine phosphatase
MQNRFTPMSLTAPALFTAAFRWRAMRRRDRETWNLCLERLEMCYAYARSEIEAGRTLLVHCRHGKDRTGMFMAHYLKMQRSLSTLEAIDQVKAVRPIALTADGWDQLAIEVLDACEAAV